MKQDCHQCLGARSTAFDVVPTARNQPGQPFGLAILPATREDLHNARDLGSTPPRRPGVLRSTRVLSVVIIPFLLVAFVVLFVFPAETERLFAWTIKPQLTPMVLGSVYLGGAYFFARAARATSWHSIKGGFVPVATFASLLGVATVLHWEKLNHYHVALALGRAVLHSPFPGAGGLSREPEVRRTGHAQR